jgi:hypothetical protein
VSGLVGYLMSLPSVRSDLNLNDRGDRELWSKRMKKKVIELAAEASSIAFSMEKPSGHLLIAYNGFLFSCDAANEANEKRDDILGDPLPQTTSTVCIQAPLQHLEECRLTIVLAPSRCL